MDMKRLSQTLEKSPRRRSPTHDDPAAVLWNNYADKKGNEPTLPPLPPLELSPRTPNGSKKDASFRRTASCGNEWPTSNAKRRKLVHHDPHSTTKQIFASRRKEMLKPEVSRLSKVSMLLESVQQSFAARERDQDEPSSSSPLPERYEPEIQNDNHKDETNGNPPCSKKQLQPTPNTPHRSSPLKGKVDRSSDYGDLDFDDDDLEVIEDALTQGHAELESQPAEKPAELKPPKPATPQKSKPVDLCPASLRKAVSPQVMAHKPPEKPIDIFDEFDDDDDVFDDELRQLAAKVDSQQASRSFKSVPAQRTTSIAAACDGAFDDLDEDLLDELDNEAVSIAQSGSPGQVRTS